MDLALSRLVHAPMMYSPVLPLAPSQMPVPHLESTLSYPARSGPRYHARSPTSTCPPAILPFDHAISSPAIPAPPESRDQVPCMPGHPPDQA
eukprot:7044006-Alexandrium_andersonii.AAC.1